MTPDPAFALVPSQAVGRLAALESEHAALMRWLAARDIQSSDASGPTIHEQEVAALKHLETVARRLEGM